MASSPSRNHSGNAVDAVGARGDEVVLSAFDAAISLNLVKIKALQQENIIAKQKKQIMLLRRQLCEFTPDNPKAMLPQKRAASLEFGRKKRIPCWQPFTNEVAKRAIDTLSEDVESLKEDTNSLGEDLTRCKNAVNKDRRVEKEGIRDLQATNRRLDKVCEALTEIRDLLSMDRINYSAETQEEL